MQLIEGVRTHLESLGIVRTPRVAGAAPPLWLAPRLGVPAPGEGQNPTEVGTQAVVGAWRTTGEPTVPYEGMLEWYYVEFRFRTTSAPIAYDIHKQIRAAIDDQRNWSCGGYQVHQSLLFRDLQFLGSDEQSYDYNSEYRFRIWA